MRITTQGDYALRCLIAIARLGMEGPVSIRRIVEEEGLPQDYIEQLLLKLRRGRLIVSLRGVNGGYRLGRAAGDISAREVLEAVEGQAFELICSRNRKARERACCDSECVLRDVWEGLKDRIERYLQDVSLQDLVEKERGEAKHETRRRAR
ncbi:MAG: RrF2 family transcriptional regulator [Deltaproteobacteria bacterium]